MKRCPRCKETKPFEAYHRCAPRPDGRQIVCIECRRKADAAYSPEEKARKVSMNRGRRHKNPAGTLLLGAKHRARRLGVAFNLEAADICIPSICPVLGIPLVCTPRRTDNTPSLDRKDPSGGYVRGNVFVVSWRANKVKTNATLDEVRALLHYMEAS